MLLSTQTSYSQNNKVSGFHYPLPPPLKLSGNFGELRSNHFHSGLDIKTEGKSGAPVKSIANGYVSRIKIGHGGFGKALYIEHPNGTTSVYAHLQKFNKEINAYVKKKQYQKESYTIELFPEANELRVRKGQVVALSGNTGGSYGPHLHFEIRKTANQHPVNPHLHGIHVQDKQIPFVSKFQIVPYNEENEIFLTEQLINIDINTESKESILKDTLLVPAAFGVQYYGHDKASTSNNSLGVYHINLKKGKQQLFDAKFDQFSFSESRYINSCIDYANKKSKNQTYTRCYRLPHNKFSVYNKTNQNGIIQLTDNNVHRIILTIKDFYGNSKLISIPVKKDPTYAISDTTKSKHSKVFYWDKENSFVCEGLELKIKANSFYNDVPFEFEELEQTDETFSPIYSLHKKTEPIHKYITIKVKVNETTLADKLILASTEKGQFYSEGGKYEDGFVTARIRSFGKYTVVADSVPPILEFIKLPSKGKSSKLSVKLTDGLSGVKSYKTMINGKWLLMEYDPKSSKMTGDISDLDLSGKLTIECRAEDEKSNHSYISKTIEWQ